MSSSIHVVEHDAKICRKISEGKIAVRHKTAGLRSGNFSDSACLKQLKVLVPVKIFQFSDMHNENRFLHTFYILFEVITYGLVIARDRNSECYCNTLFLVERVPVIAVKARCAQGTWELSVY